MTGAASIAPKKPAPKNPTPTNGLERASARLRESSEKLNKLIAAIEGRIREIDPGASLFLIDPDDLIAPYRGRIPKQIGTRMQPIDVQRGQMLGWYRYMKDWRFVVRDAFVNDHDGLDPASLSHFPPDAAITPLADAPRSIRLAAVEKLPKLIDKLAERVDAYAAEVESGIPKLDRLLAWMAPPPDDDIPF